MGRLVEWLLSVRGWWGVSVQLLGLLTALLAGGLLLGGGWWLGVSAGVWLFCCGIVLADDRTTADSEEG